MRTPYTVAVSVLVGVALGGLAVQGLHAQTKKLKAYSIGEIIPVAGGTVSPAYLAAANGYLSFYSGHVATVFAALSAASVSRLRSDAPFRTPGRLRLPGPIRER